MISRTEAALNAVSTLLLLKVTLKLQYCLQIKLFVKKQIIHLSLSRVHLKRLNTKVKQC